MSAYFMCLHHPKLCAAINRQFFYLFIFYSCCKNSPIISSGLSVRVHVS
jgi:hypothetical protein